MGKRGPKKGSKANRPSGRSMSGKPQNRNDLPWDEIKIAFMTTDMNQKELSRKFGVNYGTLGGRCRKEKWFEQKQELGKRTLEKVKTKFVNDKAKEWGKQLKLYSKIDREISKVLKKYDGTKTTINVQDLKALASTLNDSVKGQKLIKGEPTGDEVHMSFHMKTVQFIKEREKEVEKQNVIDVDG